MIVLPSKEQQESLLDIVKGLYEKHGSCLKAARQIGVSASTIHRKLTSLGIKLPARHSPEANAKKHKLQPNIEAQVVQRYTQGIKSSEIASEFGISKWAVREISRRHGADVRHKGGRFRKFSIADKNEIKRLYETGIPQLAIAAKFGSSQITISRMLNQMGVLQQRTFLRTGGAFIDSHGYRHIYVSPSHQFAAMRLTSGHALEHRLVMAEKLGRPLLRSETVHHINGVKSDNRPENLQLRNGPHGHGVVYRCNCCGSTDVSPKPLE